MKVFLIYIAIINVIAFIMFYMDKQKAKAQTWRTKEFTLHLCSFLGGSIGSILAMNLFHHKTKKVGFCIIEGIAFVWNIALVYLAWKFLK